MHKQYDAPYSRKQEKQTGIGQAAVSGKTSKLMQISGVFLCISLLLFSGCSDLLMQLGEHGSVSLEIQNAEGKTLSLQADAENGADADSEELQIEQGKRITVTAEVVPHSPETSEGSADADSDVSSRYAYRWYLNGDRILQEDSICTVNDEMAEIDSSRLLPGKYNLKVLVTYGPGRQDFLSQTVIFNVCSSGK
jgi:hypothetical protein